MNKDVMIVTGAGQISMAIARRMGYGKKIILGDKNENNALAVAKIMNQAGFDVEPFVMDMSSNVHSGYGAKSNGIWRGKSIGLWRRCFAVTGND